MEKDKDTTDKEKRKRKKLEFINLLGKRGTLEILLLIRKRKYLRFNQISGQARHISPKTIVKRLREMQHWQLVTRKAYREIPPRVEYHLTKKGENLVTSLKPLASWIDSAIRNEK